MSATMLVLKTRFAPTLFPDLRDDLPIITPRRRPTTRRKPRRAQIVQIIPPEQSRARRFDEDAEKFDGLS